MDATKVKEILDKEFVFVDEPANLFSLALASTDGLTKFGQNILIYGPAGHCKSEMTRALINGLNLQSRTFQQSFGEGMDEFRLYGSLDLAKLESQKVFEFNVERSFLSYDVAVFEELFDAPPIVLMSLKDTLTAKQLRNGAQQVPMQTKLIIALTNKQPKDISELGPAAHAITERFPLQLQLTWPHYTAHDYLSMFNKVGPRINGPDMSDVSKVLADVVASSTSAGEFISPRIAMDAYKACQASAVANGRGKVDSSDLVAAARFIPGLNTMTGDLSKSIKDAIMRTEATEKLTVAEKYLATAKAAVEGANTGTLALDIAKSLKNFLDNEVANLKATDDLAGRLAELRKNAADMLMLAKDKAVSLVVGNG